MQSVANFRAPAYAARYSGVTFHHGGCDQRFNVTARHQANILHVELIDGEGLDVILKKHPVRRGELEQFWLAGWAAA